jgi:hypothetical protein
MIELHWITATPVPAADDNSQFDDFDLQQLQHLVFRRFTRTKVGAVGLNEGKVTR